jgi:hypothetical protein
VRRRAATALGVLLTVSVLGGAGPGRVAPRAEAAPASVAIWVSFRDGAGTARRAALRCRPGLATARGFLRDRGAAPGCRRVRRLASFLAARPDSHRVCTLVYGGPQTARIHGDVGSRAVNRLFGRRDGCEIGDWNRVAGLLPPPTASDPAPPTR